MKSKVSRCIGFLLLSKTEKPLLNVCNLVSACWLGGTNDGHNNASAKMPTRTVAKIIGHCEEAVEVLVGNVSDAGFGMISGTKSYI
jgi:hypothetical protein